MRRQASVIQEEPNDDEDIKQLRMRNEDAQEDRKAGNFPTNPYGRIENFKIEESSSSESGSSEEKSSKGNEEYYSEQKISASDEESGRKSS